MMDEPTAAGVNYVSLFRRVVKRWKLILVIFLAVAIPVTVWAKLWFPKTYEASATIFIEDSRRGGPTFLAEWLPPSDASLQLAILRSRSLAEAVAEALPRESVEDLFNQSMNRDYFRDIQNIVRRLIGNEPIVESPQQRATAELLAARVRFTPMPSGEVQIQASALSPRAAMDLANTYVEVLQSRSRSYRREAARATREFIEHFLAQTKTGLQEAEDSLTKYQRTRGVINVPQRSALELAKLAQMETTLADIQASKEIAKVRLNFLKGGRDASGRVPPAAVKVALQQLRDRLAQLEDKLAGLLEKYTEQHPLVVTTQAEIKQVRASVSTTLQSLQDPRPGAEIRLGPAERAALSKQMADLEVEVSSLEAKEEILTRQIARLSRNLSTLSVDDMENLQAIRRAETQRNLYNLLSERLSTARIQEQAEGRGLRVIDLAALPASPASSPVNKWILMRLLIGLGLGIGVAALIEYLNQPIETEDDITRATGLPVLGWLPRVELGQVTSMPLSFVETPTPLALPAEGCRAIRTSLESLSRQRNLRTIMLASAGPKEGKSTVLLNLGWVFHELGRRLIVVDSDLRRPSLHRALRSPSQSGLADLLADDISWDQAQRSIKEDFVLLPAGNARVANPGALLSADKIRRFLDLATERGDLVLFDSAPLLAVSDNLILASMVDGVVLVVRAGQTQRRDLIRVKDQLEKVGAFLLGVVLNEVSPRETRRYYSRYADYYGPGDLPSLQNPWNPRSWLRRRRAKGNGRKGVLR